MDPFSISVGVASCVDILARASKRLLTFAIATKHVDASITNLQGQVHGLQAALSPLADALRQPNLNQSYTRHKETWLVLHKVIQECLDTVDDLHTKLGSLPAGNGNWAKQALRQFSLTLRQEEIDNLLTAIQTHSMNLQLVLGTVNVLALGSIPDQMIHEHSHRFERLEQMLLVIDTRLTSRPRTKNLSKDASLDSVPLNKTTEELRDVAAVIMSDASNCAGSIWSKNSASDRKALLQGYEMAEAVHSTTGSKAGSPLSPNRPSRIHNWLNTSGLSVIEEQASVDAPGHAPAIPVRAFIGVSKTAGTSRVVKSVDRPIDNGPRYKAAEHAFSHARCLFKEGRYIEADAWFSSGLEHSKDLNSKQKLLLKMQLMESRYARCCMHSGKSDRAEEIFSALAECGTEDDSTARLVYSALTHLAYIHLQRGQLDSALKFCHRAVDGQLENKAIGKDHKDYVYSLRLLVLIYWAKQDQPSACAFASQVAGKARLDSNSLNIKLAAIQSGDDLKSNASETAEPLSPSLDRHLRRCQHCQMGPLGDVDGRQHATTPHTGDYKLQTESTETFFSLDSMTCEHCFGGFESAEEKDRHVNLSHPLSPRPGNLRKWGDESMDIDSKKCHLCFAAFSITDWAHVHIQRDHYDAIRPVPIRTSTQADVQACQSLNLMGTDLMMYAARDNISRLRRLLMKTTEQERSEAFFQAAEAGDLVRCMWLVAEGGEFIDLRRRNDLGQMPSQAAQDKGHDFVAQFLQEMLTAESAPEEEHEKTGPFMVDSMTAETASEDYTKSVPPFQKEARAGNVAAVKKDSKARASMKDPGSQKAVAKASASTRKPPPRKLELLPEIKTQRDAFLLSFVGHTD